MARAISCIHPHSKSSFRRRILAKKVCMCTYMIAKLGLEIEKITEQVVHTSK